MLVALRKESVDRNYYFGLFGADTLSSLSARRAWIEMPAKFGTLLPMYPSLSARRAWIEMTYVTRLPRAQVSLSARRAWIEMPIATVTINTSDMSLSARRAWIEISTRSQPSKPRACRSPQGERG